MSCKQSMEDFCQNYCFGTSAGRGNCDHCLHKYTRYENKQAIPCFSCFLFEHRENIPLLNRMYEIWQSPEENGPGFRIGFCKIGVARRHKQLVAYLDKHAEDIVCWTLGRPIEFIPITETEYKYNCHLAATSAWLDEFTLEMISG